MEGAQLHLAHPGGSWVAVVVGAALLAVWLLGVREAMKLAAPRKRVSVMALRTLTVVLGALVALQPQWIEETIERVSGRLAVVLDVSRSMSVRDAEGQTRLERAKALVKEWLDTKDAPIDVYVAGAGAMPRATGLVELDAKDFPLDDDTRLGEAVSSLVREPREGLGAVVVISDGADHTPSFEPSQLAKLGLSVHTVAVGGTELAKDDSILTLNADSEAFLREPGQVEVRVRGAGAGTRVVTLRRDGELIGEATAQLDDKGEGTVSLPFTSNKLGRAVYSVSLPVSPDDPVPENNERAFLVRVSRDRLRVLLVCGSPSWDTRFLRAFLKADPSIDLITFFILRTGSDLSMAAPEELSLIPFPTDELFREHLDSFDLVIFQDFDFGPYQLARYLARIRDYVRGGGGFAMLGGVRSFGAGGYRGTPVEEILPVELVAGPQPWTTEQFEPRLRDATSAHPIIELAPEPAENLSAWHRLAPLAGANKLGRARDGALVLLEHPMERTPEGEPMPLLVVGSAGKGRVLALGADSSYRWGMTTAGRTGDASGYERFWDRALRWLAAAPGLDPAHIETPRESYGPNAMLEARMLLRDASYRALADKRVELVVLDQAGNEGARVAAQTDIEGKARVSLRVPSQPGGYRLAAREEGSGTVLAEEGFIVEAGGAELADPRANPAWLQALAKATGGRHFGIDSVPALAKLERSRSRSVGTHVLAPFASAWAVALLIALLTLEWAVRRAWGLR